ncbi:MAG: CRISPR-associated endonuclease Cas1 [Desulfovibrionales bacterium]|nr:MAG: CRISPR-associated endonuclease Cas1 [Desulfovibrionales bacterium]
MIVLPLIPVRMLNEHVYCPRLAYLMWVQGEFRHNEFTVDGVIKHRRVDKGGGKLPEIPVEDARIHARSVTLSSEVLGLIAKMDLVEGEGVVVAPVDYKRGKRPHKAASGVYEPEQVQVCAQGLLLEEHGYSCPEGIVYFVASRERVRVALDEALRKRTRDAMTELRSNAASGSIPAPLEDSPKCPRCSLAGICLPDEVRFLSRSPVPPRPIFAAQDFAKPLYVQSQRAYVRKDGEVLVVEQEKEQVAKARLAEISQVAVFGSAVLTTPALHECLRREIPVTWLSYGGWFIGHTMGVGQRNVETRMQQYRASFDDGRCLDLARRLVAGKIVNSRTLLRRNWREKEEQAQVPRDLLVLLREDMRHAGRAASLAVLLGVEGAAASRYFQHFRNMLRTTSEDLGFDFTVRNRRPPKDPVNAMLSFGYAMLTREWTMALSSVGLDPYRGFYHQPRFGRPALALDMMEPFRPLVADSVVLTVINNGEVRPEDFIFAAGGCNLKDAGRKKFIQAFERRLQQEITHPIFKYRITYRQLFEVQSRLLVRWLADEIPTYPVFVTR